jgi:hypothetical protein
MPLLLPILVAAAVAFAFWTYHRRELPVPGRWVPAALRAAGLVLVALLLVDPRFPVAGSASERWVLIDASASMGVGVPGASPWDSARARAELLRAEGARVLRFGGEPVATPDDSALVVPPDASRSRLVPALERAAESGAREVVVVTDLRLEDPVAARAALERIGLGVRFSVVGQDLRNAGVAELALPDDLERDQPVDGEVTLFASGVASDDTLTVEVRQEGRLVWSGRAPPPAGGRLVRLRVALPAPGDLSEGNEVRYEASVALAGDVYADDDRRVAYASVDAREDALVGVSLSPDWELRHLLPALARVTGLPTRGFVRAGERFLPTGMEGGTGEPVSEQEVAARAADARVVVLHGLGGDAPAWARAAAGRGSRVLVFTRDADGARMAGVQGAAPVAGEWYVDSDPPPSVLAGELSGLPYPALPPLVELMPWSGTDGASAPLEARLRGTGPAEPVLLLRERAGGRVAVVMASGWWRWALRPGPAEEAYGRIWSAVVGWLLGGDAAPSGRVRPLARVVEAGAPVGWTGGGVAPVRITVSDDARTVLDTTVLDAAPTLRTPPLPAGAYRYVTRAGADSASGRFDVMGAVDELRHPRATLPDSIATPAGERADAAGRPLRAYGAPWLVLIGLLCGEWITRRRRGLR